MMSEDFKEETNKNAGHRSRLRHRFLESGINSLLDYEIIELLLTLGTPRKDCKQIAKEAIKEFGGLRNVLEASIEELQKIDGIGPTNAFGIKLFQSISERLAKEKIPQRIEFNSEKNIADYLIQLIGREQKENFIAFYIDTRNYLIDSKIISIGTLDASLVHPREVFKPAVDLQAANIIIAHNHPSGEVEPSSEDREITRQLVEAGRTIGIEIKDHIIVSKHDYFSFKQQLLI